MTQAKVELMVTKLQLSLRFVFPVTNCQYKSAPINMSTFAFICEQILGTDKTLIK